MIVSINSDGYLKKRIIFLRQSTFSEFHNLQLQKLELHDLAK